MASKIRGPYDERWDTPPSITEYHRNKLASARIRWRMFKIFTYAATVTAGVLALFDERLVTGYNAAISDTHHGQHRTPEHALSWVRVHVLSTPLSLLSLNSLIFGFTVWTAT